MNQRYNPKSDTWEVLKLCPISSTDGSGDKRNNELHYLGGWNTNKRFYNKRDEYYKGPVEELHLVYNYDSETWACGGAKIIYGDI